MIDRIEQPSIPVRDLALSTAFSRDLLGLRLLFEVPNMAFFDCAGVRLMVGLGEPAPPSTGSMIYFHVTAMTEAVDRLRQHDVKIVGQPHIIATMAGRDLWLTHFHDPDGNLLSFLNDVPHQEGEVHA